MRPLIATLGILGFLVLTQGFLIWAVMRKAETDRDSILILLAMWIIPIGCVTGEWAMQILCHLLNLPYFPYQR